jgi:hypothetical protein
MAIVLTASVTVATTTAQAQYLSCDTFMERLRDAGRVLTFPLPPVKIERNPYHTDSDSDAFWLNYHYRDGDHEGRLSCVRGHFDDYLVNLWWSWQMTQPEMEWRTLRNIHIVAATIYAYTGWPAQQVIALANKLVAKQPHDLAGNYEEDLPDEGRVSIVDGDVRVTGKCDPVAFPGHCVPGKPW